MDYGLWVPTWKPLEAMCAASDTQADRSTASPHRFAGQFPNLTAETQFQATETHGNLPKSSAWQNLGCIAEPGVMPCRTTVRL